VFLAVLRRGEAVRVVHMRYPGDRAAVRHAAVVDALGLILQAATPGGFNVVR